MDKIFLIQLITSFLVGGSFIAFMSFLAERTNDKISGIVLAFPTTVALGYFFLGWSQSPEVISKIVPTTLIPFGLGVLYPIFYILTAKKIEILVTNKLKQISLSFFISIIPWFLFSIPIALAKFSNFIIGTSFYFFCLIISQKFLNKYNSLPKPKMPQYTNKQKIFRALFVGLVISLVVFLAKVSGPFTASIFTMFPAAFSSTLMVLHKQYKASNLLPIARTIPIGSLSIYVFVIASIYTYPMFGIFGGTLASYFVSLIFFLILIQKVNTKIKL